MREPDPTVRAHDRAVGCGARMTTARRGAPAVSTRANCGGNKTAPRVTPRPPLPSIRAMAEVSAALSRRATYRGPYNATPHSATAQCFLPALPSNADQDRGRMQEGKSLERGFKKNATLAHMHGLAPQATEAGVPVRECRCQCRPFCYRHNLCWWHHKICWRHHQSTSTRPQSHPNSQPSFLSS
jgi:hypothetical protein